MVNAESNDVHVEGRESGNDATVSTCYFQVFNDMKYSAVVNKLL